MQMVDDGTINRKVAKEILPLILKNGIEPAKYAEENGLGMVSDENVVTEAARAAIAENGKAVAEYKGGSKKAFQSLVGQVMKKLQGKADPRIVNKVLEGLLCES
jgi:aspartyl-tRNA(Asn)/glutamyl-tRNA(Gln) amidotransferase subunit B